MPGAGKTFWAKKIATEYHLGFADLDAIIALKEGASIAALFEQHGEACFREKEHHWLQNTIAGSATDMVIACGGGTPCFHNNMDLMNKRGVTIYLKATIPQLVNHLTDSTEVRPLLTGRGHVGEALGTLLEQRAKYYEQAQYILQTENISLSTFGQIINSCINRQ